METIEELEDRLFMLESKKRTKKKHLQWAILKLWQKNM